METSTKQTSLLNLIREQEEKRYTDNAFSYYRNQPPATEEEVDEQIAEMASAFYQKPIEFWKKLKRVLIEDQWSANRLAYAAAMVIRHCKWTHWMIADFIEMDRIIDHWTFEEAENIPVGHKPLAKAIFNGKWMVCYKADAEYMGIENQPFYTQADIKQKQKLEDYD